jgi:cold shock CspA family protein
MTVGTLTWFNADKGPGFIAPESGDDVLVQCRAIRLARWLLELAGQAGRWLGGCA